MALEDEGPNEDAVEADAGASAPADAIAAGEHDDVGEPAEPAAAAATEAPLAAETVAEPAAAAATEAPSAAEPAAAAEAEAPAAAEPVAAGAGAASAEAAGAVAAGAVAAGTGAAGAGAAGTGAAGGAGGGGSWIGNVVGGARRSSWKVATAAGAAAVIAIALVIVATNASAGASHKGSHKKKAERVSVVSVSPGNGATGVNGASPIVVTYSGHIPRHTPLPTFSPSIAGSWTVSKDKATFTPQVGFAEDTHVTVDIPASTDTTTTAATGFGFTTGKYSLLRLEQLLSQLGYLPVTWTPANPSGDIPATDAGAQLAAAYDPPSGSFTFDSGYPATLTSQWSVGTNNEIIDGAVRTFEFDQNLTMDGDAGPKVWSHLLTAVAKGERSQHGYTYVLVDQAGTEHLDLYHNGHMAITSPVNTGIAASPTVDGTFPVYLRYQVTQMEGFNPDGSYYDDTVYWVSYFNGGDAVHAFPRASYGWYQSLGCVELPDYGPVAENVWNLITYGTLVTVIGPVA
jgi:hypothetical protein